MDSVLIETRPCLHMAYREEVVDLALARELIESRCSAGVVARNLRFGMSEESVERVMEALGAVQSEVL